MAFDPMIITWDMLGLIGDYCGKIQLNSDKVRQSYVIKTKMGLRYWLTLQRVENCIIVLNNYYYSLGIFTTILMKINPCLTKADCCNPPYGFFPVALKR